jgi:hypothetical protein
MENHLIRSGCCPKFKDKFYETVKSTIKRAKTHQLLRRTVSQLDEGEWKVR